jgi:hypothetical protein
MHQCTTAGMCHGSPIKPADLDTAPMMFDPEDSPGAVEEECTVPTPDNPLSPPAEGSPSPPTEPDQHVPLASSASIRGSGASGGRAGVGEGEQCTAAAAASKVDRCLQESTEAHACLAFHFTDCVCLMATPTASDCVGTYMDSAITPTSTWILPSHLPVHGFCHHAYQYMDSAITPTSTWILPSHLPHPIVWVRTCIWYAYMHLVCVHVFGMRTCIWYAYMYLVGCC